MRKIVVRLHRWLGLGLAFFLLLTGATGALIAWQHELDALLNPELFTARTQDQPLPPLELLRRVEQALPEAQVSFLPLSVEAGEALSLGVVARPEAAPLGFNEVFVDPASGAVLGTRNWGSVWPLSRKNLVSFLYVLHYSLQLPAKCGVWLLGVVSLLWTLDCFLGFYLTLPARRRKLVPEASDPRPSRRGGSVVPAVKSSWWARWRPAWLIRWRAGRERLTFDLHRAFGLWTWIGVFVIAFSGFAMNLYDEVFYPAVSRLGTVAPSPYDFRKPGDGSRAEAVGFERVLATARQEAMQRGWRTAPGEIYHDQARGFYRLKFFPPGGELHSVGLGPSVLFFDDVSGHLLGAILPGQGGAGSLLIDLQFPLHSGRILGMPGRLLVSLLGLVICLLTVTGVLLWWRKRRARLTA